MQFLLLSTLVLFAGVALFFGVGFCLLLLA